MVLSSVPTLSMVIDGLRVMVTVSVSELVVGLGVAPLGGEPLTVAVLLTEPESTSGCVTTCSALQVVLSIAPGAKEAIVQLKDGRSGSLTVMFVSVTFPVFLTIKL